MTRWPARAVRWAAGLAGLAAVVSMSLTPAASAPVPQPTTAAPERAAGGPFHIWVSPQGDDAWPGTPSRPIRTLQHAQDLVRERALPTGRQVFVHVGGGRYVLTEPLVFDARDGGDGRQRVVWTGVPGPTPAALTGGREITGWSVDDATAGIWRAPVPAGFDTRQLYVDGERAVRARQDLDPTDWTRTQTGYETTDQSVLDWADPTGVEIVATRNWRTFRCGVAGVDASDSGAVVTMRDPCWDNAVLMHGPWGNVDRPNWAENSYDFLDRPGEWFLDEAAGVVYYAPRPGERLDEAQVVAASTERLVEVRGDPDDPVRNLTFSGLTFEHSGWLSPSSPEGYAEVQSGFHLVGEHTADDFVPRPNQTMPDWARMPGAVRLLHTDGVRFEGNTFQHLGAVGLDIDLGVNDSRITGNRFVDISGSAVQIGGIQPPYHHPDDERLVVSNNVVSNNYINRAGAEYLGAVAVWAAYTQRTVVTHNLIHDLPYSGVSLGWGWGDPEPGGADGYDTPTPEVGNRAVANHIFDTHNMLVDGGAVYTLGNHKGGVVSRNFVHDIRHIGGFSTEGFFLDEASRNISVTANLICAVESRVWLKFHRAQENTASGNFTDAPEVEVVNAGPNVVEDTTLLGSGPLPDAATEIAAEAGLEDEYRSVAPSGLVLPDAEQTCGS